MSDGDVPVTAETIDRLVAFGAGGPDDVVATLPGLSAGGAALLRGPEGRALVVGWSDIFADTRLLVRQLDDGARPAADRRRAAHFAAEMVKALVERVNRAAKSRP